MVSIWCGICRKEYNLPGMLYPESWVEKHIALHEREQKSSVEDFYYMRSLKDRNKPSQDTSKFLDIMKRFSS